jgi:hypothetical protein
MVSSERSNCCATVSPDVVFILNGYDTQNREETAGTEVPRR